MPKHTGLSATALLVSFLVSILTGCAAQDDPPGILLLTVDTLRPDYLSFNGYPLPTTPYLDALLSDEKVQELFTTELNRGQASIKRYERVRDFVLEPDEFTPENGMLTPSLKIKRRAVMAKFGDDIDAMYEADNPLIGRDE